MKRIVLIILVVLSNSVFARTDCPAVVVDNVQIEGSFILYLQSGVWRKLGDISVEGTKERYSALLAAQMSGKRVMVGYAGDTYNCNETNYKDSAYIVRTYN